MHYRKKSHRKQILAAILICELVAICGLAYGILYTVALNQAEVRVSEAADDMAGYILETRLVSEIPETEEKAEDAGEDIIEDAYIKQIADAAENLEYVAASSDTNIADTEVYEIVQSAWVWDGSALSKSRGTVTGPNGRETYYNLDMSVIVRMMHARGNTDAYWVRSDGCKMLGNYIMVAANLSVHPRGSIVRTSLGLAIVCDTGGFAKNNPQQIDVATTW